MSPKPAAKGTTTPTTATRTAWGPAFKQPREIGLEPDLEQQDQHAELGERVDDLGLVHEPEDTGPDQNAGEQLSEDRGLADPLHPLGRELRGEPDDDERDQELAEFHYRISATMTGPQAVSRMLPSA